MAKHAAAFIEIVAAPRPVHLVGHDLGGLVGLCIAMEKPALLASLSIVASAAAAPTGDGVENTTLLSPPDPLWSRESQAWVYDRLSYSHHHIDAALLDGSIAAAAGDAHRSAVRLSADPAQAQALPASIARAKYRFYKTAREDGIKVPTQIVWAKEDPLVTLDHGLWLFRIIAAKQRAAHFQVINRSGGFPFREQPEEFRRVVMAFQDGLMREAA
jgi:pimeloyl-ACP methyl ester carboxylesterase